MGSVIARRRAAWPCFLASQAIPVGGLHTRLACRATADAVGVTIARSAAGGRRTESRARIARHNDGNALVEAAPNGSRRAPTNAVRPVVPGGRPVSGGVASQCCSSGVGAAIVSISAVFKLPMARPNAVA